MSKKMPNFTATTNACKLCKPLGASIAFRGIEGCVPFLHGSQGCATYMRRYIISHFNEPIDIASSSLGEKNAIYGGGANLKLGLKNVTAKYAPKLIGVATTCLTETIGDDVPMILAEYGKEFGGPEAPLLVHVATPSYSGTHMEGFHAAITAVVKQLTDKAAPNGTVNLLPGFVSPADIRYLRSVTADFGIEATILPDYSDTLDGPALLDYPLIPEGGTSLAAIRKMGGATATVELGATLPTETGGIVLLRDHGVKLHRTGLPIGIRATDEFLDLLAEISGREVPKHHLAARGRLVDSMVDGHKYIFGKRAVVYGEEDLVVGLTGFLAEIGIRPVLCASGGKSGRMAEGIAAATLNLDCEMPIVSEDVDFYDIEAQAKELGVDLVIGHSKGYAFARKENLPLIRVGFPIHDRVGGQRILHLGYQGAQALFDLITNTVIDKKQSDSPVGYSYM
ncbi:MAG: nitrogenase [Desulfobacterales bacterium GWB2_56_26]|nr:MAG: nitrogenase [Desulfobacterales bacterium GWB2_56_26]